MKEGFPPHCNTQKYMSPGGCNWSDIIISKHYRNVQISGVYTINGSALLAILAINLYLV